MLPWVRGKDGDALRLGRSMHLGVEFEQVRWALTSGIQIGTELAFSQWVVWDLLLRLRPCHRCLERKYALVREGGWR